MANENGKPVGPDADDLDGQLGSTGSGDNTFNSIIGAKNDDGSISPASLIGTGNGDDDGYVRNADGTLKRNKDGSPRRKRGRKSGSAGGAGNSARRFANNTQDLKGAIDTLSKVIMISHIGIANATKTPELELDDKEAKALAEASANVMAEFDIRPDPKFIAIAGLVTTATSIYGPRIYVIKQRKAEAKKNRSNSVPDNQAQFEGPLTIPPGTFNLGGS